VIFVNKYKVRCGLSTFRETSLMASTNEMAEVIVIDVGFQECKLQSIYNYD